MLGEIINLKPILAAVDLLEHERNLLARQVTEFDIQVMEMRESGIYINTQIDEISQKRQAMEKTIDTLDAVINQTTEKNYELLGLYAHHRSKIAEFYGDSQCQETWSMVSFYCFSYQNIPVN